jgi:hypothetical protein
LDNSRVQWEKFVNEEGHGDLDHSGLFLLYDKRSPNLAFEAITPSNETNL